MILCQVHQDTVSLTLFLHRNNLPKHFQEVKFPDVNYCQIYLFYLGVDWGFCIFSGIGLISRKFKFIAETGHCSQYDIKRSRSCTFSKHSYWFKI